jgi:hypothetical protein
MTGRNIMFNTDHCLRHNFYGHAVEAGSIAIVKFSPVYLRLWGTEYFDIIDGTA